MKPGDGQESKTAAESSREGKRAFRKRLLTASEAAEYLGLAEQTVRNWASTGKLPKVRAYGSLRFDIEALDDWIDERTEPMRE